MGMKHRTKLLKIAKGYPLQLILPVALMGVLRAHELDITGVLPKTIIPPVQQTREIFVSGKVTESGTAMSLPGVLVNLMGAATTAVTTDFNGPYRIT